MAGQARMEDVETMKEVRPHECLKARSMHVLMANGDEASGRWVRGQREGAGCHIGPRLERVGEARSTSPLQMGVHMISGQYVEGLLTGLGKVIMKDDTVRQGTFQHSYLHGPVR